MLIDMDLKTTEQEERERQVCNAEDSCSYEDKRAQKKIISQIRKAMNLYVFEFIKVIKVIKY